VVLELELRHSAARLLPLPLVFVFKLDLSLASGMNYIRDRDNSTVVSKLLLILD
jgi:hypothetical protein